MIGSIRIDTALAEQIDALVRDFIQRNVFRGAVKVTAVSRGAQNVTLTGGNAVHRPYYEVHYEGVLDILARDNEQNEV
jgi:hypothetical protein